MTKSDLMALIFLSIFISAISHFCLYGFTLSKPVTNKVAFTKGLYAGEYLTVTELEEYGLLDRKAYDKFYIEHGKRWRTEQ